MKTSELPENRIRLTLLCHDGGVNIQNDRADIVEIGPEQTLACAAKIDANAWAWMKEQPSFMRLLRLVFPADRFDVGSEPLSQHGIGFRHVVGMIVLLKGAMHAGKTPLVKFPESHLHPSAQLGLADLFAALTAPEEKPASVE